MAFCTVDQFLRSHDNRVIREHLSDDGKPLAQADLEGNEILEQLINEATDMIRAAVQVRSKYTFEELDEMAEGRINGEGEPYQYGFYLRRLCANLTFGLLLMRRGRPAADIDRLAPGFRMAQFDLQQLREGHLILPRYETGAREQAGLPGVSGDLNADNNPRTGFRSLTDRTYGRVFPRRDCD